MWLQIARFKPKTPFKGEIYLRVAFYFKRPNHHFKIKKGKPSNIIKDKYNNWWGGVIKWMEKNNYPKPPRSACTFCPYHSNDEWREIKKNKEEWDEVVALDKKIRKGTKKNTDLVYLHKSAVPIDEAELDPNKDQQDLFNDVCDEGMCGV